MSTMVAEWYDLQMTMKDLLPMKLLVKAVAAAVDYMWERLHKQRLKFEGKQEHSRWQIW